MSRTRRSQARILAVQALCAFDALGAAFEEQLNGFLHNRENYAELGWSRTPEASVLEFARALSLGTWGERSRIDDLLRKHVPDWSPDRMQPVDRNVLRLGLYELLETPETPYAVVLNEAVELARTFGGAESPAFVNGVLDALRHVLDAAADLSTPPPPDDPT